jgi:hypothetical protein
MKQLAHSIDQETSRPCPASVRDASMDVKAVAKFGYHHSEAAKYFTLGHSAELPLAQTKTIQWTTLI